MLTWIPYDFGPFADRHPNATKTTGDGWDAIRYDGDATMVRVATTAPDSIDVVVSDADDAEVERIAAILLVARAEIQRRGPCNVWGHVTAGSVRTACADPRSGGEDDIELAHG